MEQLALMSQHVTERDLLAECSNGDREAMRILFLEHQRRVYSVALNYFGGNATLAGDITQQVFLRLLTQIGKFRGDAEFTTWLYRITVNACIDESRKTRRFTGLAGLFGFAQPRTKRDQEDRLLSREIATEVQKAVSTLKPKFRVPILLKYVEGLSYQEIAAVLNCSTGTVASRLNRGHKMLADKLGHLRNEI